MLDSLVTFIIVGIALVVPMIYWLRHRRHEVRARERLEEAHRKKLNEPASLHPVIDPNRCISIGACVKACPEGEILGIVNGAAKLISPSKCIGHGACQTSCPVDAISLVFGTATRGVEIPNVRETFESNVPGLYIAGELGGMGLIRNAVTQGRQAVEYIAKELKRSDDDLLDLIVVGGGPAGLSATLQAKQENLSVVTLDQEKDIGGTILSFPRQKVVMTQEMEIPLHGKVKRGEILKEDLIDLWQGIVSKNRVEINLGHKVEEIVRENGHFFVKSHDQAFKTRRVLLTTGRRGTPRKLGVPGENSSKVTYKLIEPEQYVGRKVLVVGGGDSAVEAALALAKQPGTTVTLSYRKDSLSRIKEKNRELVNSAISSGQVSMLFNSQVSKIESGSVSMTQEGKQFDLANDFLFVFIGGELPSGFLKKIGVDMETKFGQR